MRKLFWWLAGWRCVYEDYVDPNEVPGYNSRMPLRETFPKEMKLAIQCHGGEDAVRILGSLYPFGLPYIEYEVWAKP